MASTVKKCKCKNDYSVTFPATEFHWPVPNYTACWQRHMGVNNLPRVVTWQCNSCEPNLWPLDHNSVTLTTPLPSHLVLDDGIITFCYEHTAVWVTEMLIYDSFGFWALWLGMKLMPVQRQVMPYDYATIPPQTMHRLCYRFDWHNASTNCSCSYSIHCVF